MNNGDWVCVCTLYDMYMYEPIGDRAIIDWLIVFDARVHKGQQGQSYIFDSIHATLWLSSM